MEIFIEKGTKVRKAIIINTHSFVDVITNSSTELFVLDTEKSIEMVEEILKEFCNSWNNLASTGAFGHWHTRNNRKSLTGKGKPPQIRTYDDMFGSVRLYDKNQYKRDKKENGTYKGWGYELESNIGNIIITSADDNSIPYEMFDWIEQAFGKSTKRFHLG